MSGDKDARPRPGSPINAFDAHAIDIGAGHGVESISLSFSPKVTQFERSSLPSSSIAALLDF